MGGSRQRHMSVRFRQALSENASPTVTATLLSIEGVTGAAVRGSRLDIAYTFPEANVKTILAGVDQVTCKAAQRPLNRFNNMLFSFLETNERDHLLCAGGWHRYIEDIYLRCSDHGLNDRSDFRNQTWRKYK